MFREALLPLLVATALALVAGCGTQQESPSIAPNIANPASVYCEQNGGKLDFQQDATDASIGICKFTDATECEEWAFFRGQCKRGDKLSAPSGPTVPTRATPPAVPPAGDD